MLLSVDATKVLLFFTKVSPEVPLNKLVYNDQSSTFFCSIRGWYFSHFPFSPLLTCIGLSSPSCSSFYSSSILLLYPHLTCLLKPVFSSLPGGKSFWVQILPLLILVPSWAHREEECNWCACTPHPLHTQAWHTTERSWWPVDLVNNRNLQLSFSFFFLNTHDIDIAILKNCKGKTNYYTIIVNAVSDNPISSLDTWVHCLVGSHPG